MDLVEHNRNAWNEEVRRGNMWTVPVGEAELKAAAQGDFKIVLTPHKPIPAEWLGNIQGQQVLCLASGGGQQGPILAAAGADVTVFDNSDEQLRRDAELSAAFDLGIKTVQGNMQDLSALDDATFDLIIHPVSNCFIDDIRPVWRESHRVLRPNGSLLSGFVNPLLFMLDWDNPDVKQRRMLVHGIPYSDLRALSAEKQARYVAEQKPFEFGHSLTDQIQGQIAAGFVIAGFYEDGGEEFLDPLTESFIATRAIKLDR